MNIHRHAAGKQKKTKQKNQKKNCPAFPQRHVRYRALSRLPTAFVPAQPSPAQFLYAACENVP
jgi:hypothetical protein